MYTIAASIAALALATSLPAQAETQEASQQKKPEVGYKDTPMLPGQKWRVHDGTRPQPKKVEPGRASTPEKAGTAPSDAVVLFDGDDLDAWTGRDGEAGWKVVGGCAEVNGTGDIRTREEFGDCQLHIEWAAPADIKGDSQGRGNSGVFMMGRYEIQVLDSRDNVTYADGQAAALYGQFPPLVNAARQPGEWQTYDIIFTAPRFDGDELVSPAYATVIHNGVVVHNHRALIGASTHRRVAKYEPHPAKGPIRLQDHGNPVRFRNIWVRPIAGGDETER